LNVVSHKLLTGSGLPRIIKKIRLRRGFPWKQLFAALFSTTKGKEECIQMLLHQLFYTSSLETAPGMQLAISI